MDFVDWRKSTKEATQREENATKRPERLHGQRYHDYIEEIIQQAQERGEFSNLKGMGKPLHFADEHAAGDNAMAYRLLKNNDCAPPEIEVMKEVRSERERIDAKIARVIHQYEMLRSRRVPPFASEKHAFNMTVEKAAREYEEDLRKLNSRILTLNLTAPAPMHQLPLHVDELVQQFREACPLFEV
ncbi:MAG TPA: DnaJ family domain-containing protein [Ktedonobacteraceae bacterium]|jgi:DnaJ family protein C protein 28|nr:DnaJ family domain-containing protein [Ktedonobacteraceae bacterium]